MDGEPDVVRGGVGGEEPQQAQPFDQLVHGVEWRHRSPRQQELAGEGGSVEGPQAQHVVAHGVIMADGPGRGWRRYTVTDSDATYPSSTLPVMVAIVVSLGWRRIPAIAEVHQGLAREGVLWAAPRRATLGG